ncbi:hypothetical protein T265_00911 [Opisthorchis viverrini]|uniref:Uncharacterized protein n=1 Tax=Opisthorchis viverrini TaxID=6198 RepID=A0A075AJE1_OPIVI|nr:hypothetical protein T265_00911 [Opisthorchis viverrini]KER33224.1 hypothetical protein T265_00911 [Opisthorchis viverrini]
MAFQHRLASLTGQNPTKIPNLPTLPTTTETIQWRSLRANHLNTLKALSPLDNSVKYSGSVESKFNAVDWMQADHAEELAHFYSSAVLEMHCNNSAGTRIPGSAIHVMPTQVSQHPIPVTTLNKLKCFLPDK